MFHNFYDAFHFLERHQIFDGRYTDNLDVDVVKVNPATEEIDDNHNLNTETRVWFEANPHGCLDFNLWCGGKTYEEATIILANRVLKYYGKSKFKRKPKMRVHV